MAPIPVKPVRKRKHYPSPSQNQNVLPASMRLQHLSGGGKKKTKLDVIESPEILHAYNTRSRIGNRRQIDNSNASSLFAEDNVMTIATGIELGKYSSPVTAAPPIRKISSLIPAPLIPGRCLSPDGLHLTEDNHLLVKEGDVVGRRYQILHALGSGTFGQVVAVRDMKKKSSSPDFALKITQATPEAKDDWAFEKAILFKLNEVDREGKYHLVRLFNAFMYHDHPCLVFEKLAESLHSFIQKEPFRPLVMANIGSVTQQLCEAMMFLHGEGLTHTDLKPENIAFTVPFSYNDHRENRGGHYVYSRTLSDPSIRIIDFGSAVNVDDHHGIDVTTRQYRSPEVMLELGWSYPLDVWSCGCILFELYSGHVLFSGPTVKDQLAVMEHALGLIPPGMLKRSAVTHLVTKGKFIYDATESGWAFVRKHAFAKPLKSNMRDEDKSSSAFFELLTAMFRFDPRYRITMADALKHPFFATLSPTSYGAGSSSTTRAKVRV